MATSVPILIQDLPAYISPKTGEPVTIPKTDFLSLLDNLDVKPKSQPSITKRLNPDGSPYAYASVNFESHEQAIEAISQINFTLINKVPIRVVLWDQKTRSDLLAGENKIIIINLPIDISISALENTMNNFGHVIDCQIPTRYGKPLSYGIIQFDNHDDVVNACARLYKKSFNGQKVQVIEMPDYPVKKIQNLNKNFKELLFFSGKNESNQLFYKKSNFISPPISYPIQNLSLSYSVYSQHSIIILENKKAVAVGMNNVHQINHSVPQLFEKQTIICIQNSKNFKIDSFSSAVCGSKYTLYLCNPTEKINHPFLAFQSKAKNATIFDPMKKVPVALYGGEIVSAAINSDGTIIFTNSKNFYFAHLPDNEKAVQLACTNKIIFALSKSGHLYMTPSNPPKNSNDIKFSPIKEVSNVTFVSIAGTSEHALAVDEEGFVYGRGKNDLGQLGMNSLEESLVENFVRLPKFTESKIVSASCGVDHSLFFNERGAIYACGNNKSGQLFFNKFDVDGTITKPTKTPIKSGATFCIAGNGLSVAFMHSQPPPSTPNQKYEEENDYFKSDHSHNSEENDHQDRESNYNMNNNNESSNNDNENINNADGGDVDTSCNMKLKSIHDEINQITKCVRKHNEAINQFIEESNEISKVVENLFKKVACLTDSSQKQHGTKKIQKDEEELKNYNEESNEEEEEDIEFNSNNDEENDDEDKNDVENEEEENDNKENEEEENDNKENEEEENVEENEEEEVNIDDDLIEKVIFSKDRKSLDSLSDVPWECNTTKYVEFFKNELTRVQVIDITSPSLKKTLEALKDGHPISVDFEWLPDYSADSKHPISLFQFCSSKGVLIVLNAEIIVKKGSKLTSPSEFRKACPHGINVLMKFFSSNSFYGKGMGNDKIKVNQFFGKSFQFEDLAVTRIKPHNYPLNFSKLVNKICGKTVVQFKDKRVSRSKWNKRPLSSKQVIYAAFDAFATRLFWKHFVEKFGEDEVL